MQNELLNEESFDNLDDARTKLALCPYDYNQVRPHSSLENQTPEKTRRALEKFEAAENETLAQNQTEKTKNIRINEKTSEKWAPKIT